MHGIFDVVAKGLFVLPKRFCHCHCSLLPGGFAAGMVVDRTQRNDVCSDLIEPPELLTAYITPDAIAAVGGEASPL